jgi:replication factor C subunit 2/4
MPFLMHRIIEPVASRCSKFRFRMLDSTSTKDRLEAIAKTEGVAFEEGVLDTLIKTSDGDLRRAITYLQSASRLHGVDTEKSSAITPKSIIEIAGVVPEEVVRSLARAMGVPLRKGEDEAEEMASLTKKTTGFEQLRGQVSYVTREGYSTTQLLIQVSEFSSLRHAGKDLDGGGTD